MSYDHGELIECVRKANKLLSLYVLALQDDAAVQPTDHAKLVEALRVLADTIEEHAEQAPNNHSVIEGVVNHAAKPDDTATEA